MAKTKRSRKSPSSDRYKKEGRRLINKIKRLEKYLKRHPNDKQAIAALDKHTS